MRFLRRLGSPTGAMASVRRTWLLLLLSAAAVSLMSGRQAAASAMCAQEGKPCNPLLPNPCCNSQTVCGDGDTGVFICNAVE